MIKNLWHFDLEPNMSRIDRYARFTLSITLISSMLFISPTPIGWLVVLPLIAIPVFISAYAGWDPIYALFQKQRTAKFRFFNKKRVTQ